MSQSKTDVKSKIIWNKRSLVLLFQKGHLVFVFTNRGTDNEGRGGLRVRKPFGLLSIVTPALFSVFDN